MALEGFVRNLSCLNVLRKISRGTMTSELFCPESFKISTQQSWDTFLMQREFPVDRPESEKHKEAAHCPPPPFVGKRRKYSARNSLDSLCMRSPLQTLRIWTPRGLLKQTPEQWSVASTAVAASFLTKTLNTKTLQGKKLKIHNHASLFLVLRHKAQEKWEETHF